MEAETMTALDLQQTLEALFETITDAREMEDTSDLADAMLDAVDDLTPEVDSVRSFESAGVMTSDAGLVVRLADGSEFQITIVQSKPASR